MSKKTPDRSPRLGVLVLGKVETMTGQAKESFVSFDAKERIYRRSR